MKISIVTATYNSAETIKETIESVLNQDYPNVEYIIVDGASKDGTDVVVNSFGDRINKFISEPDKGIYDALNKGIKAATGDVIGIIGADDFYPNNQVLSTVAEAFLKYDVDSLYGDKQYVDPIDTEKVVRYWKAGEFNPLNFEKGWMPPHLSFYLKKSIYDKHGLYHPNFKCSGDYELMLRMLYKYKISSRYLPKLLITMRAGGTSNASFQHRITANKEDRKAWVMNDLKPRFYTLWLKPISKIHQLFSRG